MGSGDDHDAAARIVALEAQVARLEQENQQLRRARPSEPKRARLRLRAAAPVIIAILAGVIASSALWRTCNAPASEPAPSGTGTLTSTGPTFGGPWTFEVGRCASGQRSLFFGVDLVAKDDPSKVLRIVEDPVRGTIVRLNVVGPAGKANAARFIERTECTRWDIELRPTTTTTNGVRLVDGHVELACAFAGGGTLAGRLDFTSCN